MRRLALAVLVLALLLAGVITVVRQTARNIPSPFRVIFTAPGDITCANPCLFGLTPGTMTFEEAIKALGTHPLTIGLTRHEGGNEHYSTFQDDQINLILVMSSQDARLSSVWLTSMASGGSSLMNRLTLGDVVRLFGAPHVIHLSGAMVEMIYPQQRLVVGAVRQAGVDFTPLRMSDHVAYLSMVTPDQILPSSSDPSIMETTKRWLGFASVRYYWNSPRLPVYP